MNDLDFALSVIAYAQLGNYIDQYSQKIDTRNTLGLGGTKDAEKAREQMWTIHAALHKKLLKEALVR